MPYLFDYVEHELATFNQKPFGPVDAAVLSQACMIDGAGVVPSHLRCRHSSTGQSRCSPPTPAA